MTVKAMIFLIAALMAIGYIACDPRRVKKKVADKVTEKPVEHTKEARKEGRMENLDHEAVNVVGVDKTADSHKTQGAHPNVEPQAEGNLNRHKRGGYGGQGYGHNVQGHKGHEKIVVVVGKGHQGHDGHNHGGFDDHVNHGGHGHGDYGEHGGHGGGGHGYGRR